MKHDSQRDPRWMAYLMGEGDPHERAAIEAEMRANPEAAEACRRVVAGVEKWAGEAVPAAPLDFEALYAQAEVAEAESLPRTPETIGLAQQVPAPRSSGSKVWVWVAGVAASALLVLALTQVRFTLQLGSATLHWGVGANPHDLAALKTQLDTVASEARESRLAAQAASVQIQAVSQRSSLMQEEFRQATAGLAWMQRAESQRRYRDVETLMRLTGLYPSAHEWMEASAETRPESFRFPESQSGRGSSLPAVRPLKTEGNF